MTLEARLEEHTREKVSKPVTEEPATVSDFSIKQREQIAQLEADNTRLKAELKRANRLTHDVQALGQLNAKLQTANEQLRLEIVGLGRLLTQPVHAADGGVAVRTMQNHRLKLKNIGKKIEREVRRIRNRFYHGK